MILQGEAERRNNYYYEFDRSQGSIGQGGMGVVFKGRMVDETTGASRDVAIKEIVTEGSPNEQALVVDRAKREASIRLNNDNVVEMMGFVEVHEKKLNISKTRYYVVSEFLDGVTLDKVLEGDCLDYHGDPVDYAVELHRQYEENREETAARITRNLLSAIMAIHDLGYIHRDIDPSNIMVTRDGHIKLFDLGIALKSGDGNSLEFQKLAGAAVGKAKYSAPELISGQMSLQNYTTDTYSIGVIFYQLITGHLPFEGNNFDIQQGHLKKKPDLRGIKSSLYRDVIAKALQKKQSRRFQSSASMRSALDGIDPVPHSNTGLLVALACVALLVLVIILWPKRKHVESYCDNDIESIWEILEKEPNEPGALYAIAECAEDPRYADKSVFEEYLEKHYVSERYDKRYIKDGRFISPIDSFCYISLCRAYEHFDDYNLRGKELILSEKKRIEKRLLDSSSIIESVESYCEKDIDSIWRILEHDPEHPGALFAIARYAETEQFNVDRSKFEDFHKKQYVKNSYNKLYLRDKEQGCTSIRFRFISLCRAYESLKSGKYQMSGKELVISKIESMMHDPKKRYGNNLVYNE